MSGIPFAPPINPPMQELSDLARFVNSRFPNSNLDELNEMAHHTYTFLSALSHINDDPNSNIRDTLVSMITNPTTCDSNLVLEAVRRTGALWMLIWCNIRHDQPNFLPNANPHSLQ
jgi:hypothetical protein